MRKLVLLLLLVSFPFLSIAEDHWKKIGNGRLNYLFWHVYDADLYSLKGTFSFEHPLKLELTYQRKLYGKEIAKRSLEEMQKLGLDNPEQETIWLAQMTELFPDVSDGTRLSAIYSPNSMMVFYRDDIRIGEINDPEFGRWFFRIWLDENTSEPKLRKALLGL